VRHVVARTPRNRVRVDDMASRSMSAADGGARRRVAAVVRNEEVSIEALRRLT
jgi:hypothetical protein